MTYGPTEWAESPPACATLPFFTNLTVVSAPSSVGQSEFDAQARGEVNSLGAGPAITLRSTSCEIQASYSPISKACAFRGDDLRKIRILSPSAVYLIRGQFPGFVPVFF